MTEVGKAAKKMGTLKAAVLKKLDPQPEKPTPKRTVARKAAKHFGFSYEFTFGRNWTRWNEWFKTETARDQALAAFLKKNAQHEWIRDIRKEQRE